MRVFRYTDGYTEVTATAAGTMVEVYFSVPDSSTVIHGHFSARLAWRLGLWLLFYWIRDRAFGFRSRWEARTAKSKLFEAAEKETVQ